MIQKKCLPKIFWTQDFFGPNIFFHSIRPKICSDLTFFHTLNSFSDPKFFQTQKLSRLKFCWTQNLLYPKFFLTQNFHGAKKDFKLKFFWTKHSFPYLTFFFRSTTPLPHLETWRLKYLDTQRLPLDTSDEQ